MICNVPKKIPIVFHNGSKYDYQFVIKKLAVEFKGELECLGEKYITFSVPLKKENDNGEIITHKLKFIDSYRFMQTSLSNLVHNKFFLLLRKGICPYEYMDSWERFDENIIPPKEAFYSKLSLDNITDKDYEHVKKVWEA